MNDEAVADRLDEVIGLLRLIATPELDRLRLAMEDKPVHLRVLAETRGGWTRSGEVKKRVAKGEGVSEKSAQRACLDLVEQGLLDQRGDGPSREYRSKGWL